MRLTFAPDIRSGFRYLSNAVIASTADRVRSYVLIPDQMTVTTERELAESTPPSSQLYYDTVSFRRLSDNIHRALGGVKYNYADKSAEQLIMWRALRACGETLSVLGATSSDPSAVPQLHGAIVELKQSMITPSDLMAAAVRLSLDGKHADTAKKYIDIANIYEAYDEILGESFDDRHTDLTSSAQLISKHDFFRGSRMYVFAFSSFTYQQYAILRRAIEQCDDVDVIFTLPTELGDGFMFDGIHDTVKRLRAAAEDAGRRVYVEKIRSERGDALAELAGAIWKNPASASGKSPDGIRIVECGSRRAEAEMAAIEIARAVRDGFRYRDIAVCAGSVEDYRGIIDETFEDFKIPYHLSFRMRLETIPEAALILSALRIVTGGWRLDDIIAYCRTGLSGIDDDAADELEIYMSVWRIQGRRFYDPDGGAWSMNPDGYTAVWSDEGESMLGRVNESRVSVVTPLTELHDVFASKSTAREKSDAIRGFTEEMHLFDRDDAVISQLSAIVSHALDTVSDISGDENISSSDYMACLELVLDTLTVGTIPGKTDEVEICDPVRMRGAGYRFVIMMGCNDRVFPRDTSDGGFFSDAEKLILADEGIDLGGDNHRASMEIYNFSRSISSSYEKLTVSFLSGAKNLPDAVDRIKNVFPSLDIEKFDGAESIDDIYSYRSVMTSFTKSPSRELAEAERKILSDTDDGRRILDHVTMPISDPECRLDEKTAAELFSGDIMLSQSRLEKYVICQFSYYCDYVLALEEKHKAALAASDIGTFIHAVLEKIFTLGIYKDKENAEEKVREVIGEYVDGVIPQEERNNARLAHLFRRLERSVMQFLHTFGDEFEKSRFTPVRFELPIGIGDDSVAPIRIHLDGGGDAVIRGIADRVDVYEDGDTLFVRVVDYKTGTKKYDPEDVGEGIGLQLPLYLCTLTGNNASSAALGGGEKKLKPAGFLYVGVRPEDDKASDTDRLDELPERRLPRSGLLLNDESVLRAMDPALSGEYIPVRIKKDGTPDARSLGALTDEDGFAKLYEDIKKTVGRICGDMRGGIANAEPRRSGRDYPCRYCKMRSVCRSMKGGGRNG